MRHRRTALNDGEGPLRQAAPDALKRAAANGQEPSKAKSFVARPPPPQTRMAYCRSHPKGRVRMKKTQLYLLAFILAAVGLGATFYKWQVLRFPLQPVAETEVWELQARVEFDARRGANKATLQLPNQPPGFTILDERFVARNYGMTIDRDREGREVIWAIRRASGRQALYYRATVYRDQVSEERAAAPSIAAPEVFEEPFATARQSLLDDVREKSVDSATFAGELIRRLNSSTPSEEVKLLLENVESLEDRVDLAKGLLAQRQIATRRLNGLILETNDSTADLIPFLEIFDTSDSVWRVIDPTTGQIGWPDNLFVWSVGERPVLAVEGVRGARVTFSVQTSLADALETAKSRLEARDRNLIAYSLLDLPLQAQEVYRILLLVPIGAFIMLILRNLVGIKTFGTFMPVLIALAFNWTGIIAGVILFTLVISLGLLVRFYMERLKLLLVPRLTAVLIVVVLLMALVTVVSNRLGLEVGLNVALFPMIILTMTIERVSVAWEERGPGFAISQALGSIAIAALAYLVMREPHLQHLVFVFPELLLVLLALTLLLGRYSGYRLTELFRFRALAREKMPPPSAPSTPPVAGG